jgi:mycobactin phenyloxazoline synthetase
VALRVVDHLGGDRPDWVAGELWIGGDAVARGYRGDPERTAERFVERDGRRWYRTGDLARYRPDGTVEFLGRRDDQVKIRGFRVELGDVEAALRADPRVRAAVAVLTTGAAPGLAAAVATTGAVDPASLRASAAELVPAHMVPDQVVVLDALPLTANGKLDRDAARELVERAGRPVTGQQPPRDELEQVIALVWAESLRLPEPGRLGVTDDFFAAGGDSLLATTLVSNLREALDTSAVSVRMLFAEPTVAGLAERLRAADPTGRLDKVAALYCEVAAMSDDEVAAALDADGWPR